MRSYAVIPPIQLDARQRRVSYVNNNGRIEDFVGEYKERQLLNVWTSTEHEIFKEKYLQHPKNFGVIKTYLDRKSVSDCVQHYYLTKKTENYKQLLRKSRQRTRASRNNPHGKPSSTSQNNLGDVLSGPTGVTTRLQREQQQKQEQPNNSASSVTNSANGTSSSTPVTTTTTTSTSSSTSTTTSSTSSSNAITLNSSSASTATSVSAISTASEQSQLSVTITTTSVTPTTANSTVSVTVTTVAPLTVVSSTLTVSLTSSSPVSSVPATASVNAVSSSSVSISNNNNNNSNNNNNNNLTPSKDQHLFNDKDGVDKENKSSR